MEHQLNKLLQTAKIEIQKSVDLKSLELVQVKFLGKKGELTQILKEIGKLSAEDKPKIGAMVNTIKKELQEEFFLKEQEIRSEAVLLKLTQEQVDITLPGRMDRLGNIHPITQVKSRIVSIFSQLGFAMVEGPEVESEYYNFEALNIPSHHPARGMQDTFYFPNNLLLRTHTSPVQIREMEQNGVPIRLISLGRVYRRDSDQTHTPMFHQVEGLLVEKHCTFADLKGILTVFLNQFFETDLKIRFRPSYFPFTEPSAEVDIFNVETGAWLEVLGCGMVHPQVLRNVNVNPDQYSGYAFGVGLDRLAMLLFGIPDLRMLFENDIRFLQQF